MPCVYLNSNPIKLLELPKCIITWLKCPAQAGIEEVAEKKDAIATRLTSLGFVTGEKVEVLTRGIFGGEPLLIKIGFTRFALRSNEAERIEVELV